MKRTLSTGAPTPATLQKWLLIVFLGIVSVLIFFREFFLSGFRMIVGDTADGRLILSIHEHWYRFLLGKESFFDLSFFYPVKGVLGYSDTFLLQGLGYSIFRMLGIDQFYSFQFTYMVLLWIGFLGMFFWLHHSRHLSFIYSLFGTFLFSIASPLYMVVYHSHVQLMSVCLVPWLFLLVEKSWKDSSQDSKQLIVSFTALCTLYGMLIYSTYYIGWFFFLFSIFFVLCSFVFIPVKLLFSLLISRFKCWIYLLPGLLILSLFGGLFLHTYLPVHQGQGGRSLDFIFGEIPYIWEFINRSRSNLVWGDLSEILFQSVRWGLASGPTFTFTLLTLIASCAFMFRRSPIKGDKLLLKILGLAWIFASVSLWRISNFSLWEYIFQYIPGADGIRVPQRFVVLLLVPGIYVCISGLSELDKFVKGTLPRTLLLLISLLILLEQVQLVNIARIDRIAHTAELNSLPDPPADALAFYLIGAYENQHEQASIHTKAMLYSQHWNLPTINGRSGFTPNHFFLENTNLSACLPHLVRWGNSRDISGSVYLFALAENNWVKQITFPYYGEPVSGDTINLLGPDFQESLLGEGWSQREGWGLWNNGSPSILFIPPVRSINGPMLLKLSFQAFLPEEHKEQKLAVLLNGELIHREEFNPKNRTSELSIPIEAEVASKGFKLTLISPDSISPRELGLQNDSRQLGVGLSQLTLEKP